MKIIRFKIVLEENPEVIRVIDIPEDECFEDLHHSILQSVNFDSTQLASFFICNDTWEKKVEITLIEMDVYEDNISPVMGTTSLSEYIAANGQKIIYEYDFVLMWRFLLEVEDIYEAQINDEDYPCLVDSIGEAPAQYEAKGYLLDDLTDEDTRIIHELEIKNMDLFHHDERDEDFDDDGGEDDLFDEDEFRDKGYRMDDDDYF